MKLILLFIISFYTIQAFGQNGSTNIFEGNVDQYSGAVIYARSTTDSMTRYVDYDYPSYLQSENITAVWGESYHKVKEIYYDGIEDRTYYYDGGMGAYFGGYHGMQVNGTKGVGIKINNSSSSWAAIDATNTNGNGLMATGEGYSKYGIVAYNKTGIGLSTRSDDRYGILASSYAAEGGYFSSSQKAGAIFKGGKGIAIELKTGDSVYGVDNDDAVIITSDKEGSDLILVANDAVAIHLDDDNNSSSSFAIKNGSDEDILRLDENGNLTITGTYSPSSDVNRKEYFREIDPNAILDKISQLPISKWQYKGESIQHIGPMAQDFFKSFGLGQGNKTISTVDADGISLAAIQALHRQNKDQQALIDSLLVEIQEIQTELKILKKNN